MQQRDDSQIARCARGALPSDRDPAAMRFQARNLPLSWRVVVSVPLC